MAADGQKLNRHTLLQGEICQVGVGADGQAGGGRGGAADVAHDRHRHLRLGHTQAVVVVRRGTVRVCTAIRSTR